MLPQFVIKYASCKLNRLSTKVMIHLYATETLPCTNLLPQITCHTLLITKKGKRKNVATEIKLELYGLHNIKLANSVNRRFLHNIL